MSGQRAFISSASLGGPSLSKVPAALSCPAVAILADYVDEDGKKVSVVREGPGNLSSLVHHPALEQYNITISKTLKLPVCGWCNYGVECKSLTRHLRLHKKNFKAPLPPDLEKVAQEVIESIDGPPQPIIPNPADGPHPPVQGLRVRKGFICRNKMETGGSCGIGMFSMASMKTHWRKNICVLDGAGSFREGYIQSVFSGNRRCFFEVTKVDEGGEIVGSKETETLCDVACLGIDKDFERLAKLESPKSQSISDSRCLNLFLLKTNWARDAEGLDLDVATSYVAGVDMSSPEEVMINYACNSFLENVGNYCDQEASYTVRRYIKSWDGDQGVGREGLVGMKDAKTMKK